MNTSDNFSKKVKKKSLLAIYLYLTTANDQKFYVPSSNVFEIKYKKLIEIIFSHKSKFMVDNISFTGQCRNYSTILKINEYLLAFTSENYTIKIWDLRLNKPYVELVKHECTICAIEKISDKLICSLSEDKFLKVWDIHRGECIKVIFDGDTEFSPSNTPDKMLYFGNDVLVRTSRNCLSVWSLKQDKQIVVIKDDNLGTPFTIVKLQSSKILLSSNNLRIFIYNIIGLNFTKIEKESEISINNFLKVKNFTQINNVIGLKKNNIIFCGDSLEIILYNLEEKTMKMMSNQLEIQKISYQHNRNIYADHYIPNITLYKEDYLISLFCHSKNLLKIWDIKSLTCVIRIEVNFTTFTRLNYYQLITFDHNSSMFKVCDLLY